MVLQSLATSMPQVSWRDEVTFMVAKCPAMPAHLVRSPWEPEVFPPPQHRLSRTSSRTSCCKAPSENHGHMDLMNAAVEGVCSELDERLARRSC